MTMSQILQAFRCLDGILELAPCAGSDFPEIAWGDHFFYYAPDGQVPERQQPFATIVTKDYPEDTLSDLSGPDRWRLNIHVGTRAFTELIGEPPRSEPAPRDYTEADVLLPHPVYRSQGWVAIVNPGPQTLEAALVLVRGAHAAARERSQRR